MKLVITIPIDENLWGIGECRANDWTDADIIEMMQEEYGAIEEAEYALLDDGVTHRVCDHGLGSCCRGSNGEPHCAMDKPPKNCSNCGGKVGRYNVTCPGCGARVLG